MCGEDEQDSASSSPMAGKELQVALFDANSAASTKLRLGAKIVMSHNLDIGMEAN